MILLTPQQRARLRANGDAAAIGTPGHDPAPVVKLFNPVGAATWLATELDADNDTLFGLADLGFGCPELGSFSPYEIGRAHVCTPVTHAPLVCRLMPKNKKKPSI